MGSLDIEVPLQFLIVNLIDVLKTQFQVFLNFLVGCCYILTIVINVNLIFWVCTVGNTDIAAAQLFVTISL